MSLANAFINLAGGTLEVVGFWQQGLCVLLGDYLSHFLFLECQHLQSLCLVTLLQDDQDWIYSKALHPKAHTRISCFLIKEIYQDFLVYCF